MSGKQKKIKPINLDITKTFPIKQRKNKVKVSDFAQVSGPKASVKDLVCGLPNILIGQDFREIIAAIINAYNNEKPVILGMGAHVIKCGLSPWIIELMRKKVITSIAMNGAGSIHDFEIALIGETSEDVPSGLIHGTFGMAGETGELIHQALSRSEIYDNDMGMGEAIGNKILEIGSPYANKSLLASAVKLEIPITIHVALGTDIIHMHNNAIGPLIGQASFTDFRIFASTLTSLSNGGVYLNMGSAVLLPEIFQKSLNILQNLGYKLSDFVTANFDMEQRYRATQNIVRRPQVMNAKGYSFIGHHELIIPLLASTILEIIDINQKA